MSIRVRLTIAIAVVMVVTIAIFGVFMVTTTRATLIDQLDAQVIAQAERRAKGYESKPPPEGGYGNYGDYYDLDDPSDSPSYHKNDFANLIYGPTGDLREAELYGYADDRLSPPDCPDIPSPELDSMLGNVVTLPSLDGSLQYRTLMQMLDTGEVQAVAAPLTDVDEAVSSLLRGVVIASVLAMLAAVGICWLVIRQGLKPVDNMVDTAAAIAGGDLGARMSDIEPGTELGRLGTALNDMMTQIQTSDAARAEGERRLRRFVADAAHELRTPLTSLRGYAELYRQGALPDSTAVDNAMGRIESEGARMARLVDDLLLLARLDQDRGLERKPVNLVGLAQDAVQDFRVVAPGHPITLATDDRVEIQGDRMRLRQVIDNLLSNVRTHTPAGTSVQMSVTTDDGHAVIVVADDGPGVSPDDQEHIFERFWRADPARTRSKGGSGLGLAIVASLVEAHGGDISLESTPGQGATFVVRLPR
jgi:two-component system OmpR family sensor kinase